MSCPSPRGLEQGLGELPLVAAERLGGQRCFALHPVEPPLLPETADRRPGSRHDWRRRSAGPQDGRSCWRRRGTPRRRMSCRHAVRRGRCRRSTKHLRRERHALQKTLVVERRFDLARGANAHQLSTVAGRGPATELPRRILLIARITLTSNSLCHPNNGLPFVKVAWLIDGLDRLKHPPTLRFRPGRSTTQARCPGIGDPRRERIACWRRPHNPAGSARALQLRACTARSAPRSSGHASWARTCSVARHDLDLGRERMSKCRVRK